MRGEHPDDLWTRGRGRNGGVTVGDGPEWSDATLTHKTTGHNSSVSLTSKRGDTSS